MDIRKVFGANARRFRLALKLSQEAVAERMGVDRAFISSMERGKQNATLLTIWEIAQALEVRPMELLEEKGSKTRTRPEPRQSEESRLRLPVRDRTRRDFSDDR